MEIYVDNAYASIAGNENMIWNNINKYIQTLNKYYINNKLINNLEKTKIMIITNSQTIKEKNNKTQEQRNQPLKNNKNTWFNLQ